jgi:hypothetical protein
VGQLGVKGFDGDLVLQNGRCQRHSSSDHQRPGQLQHNKRKACPVQTISNTSRQIAAAAQNYELFLK